MTKQELLDAIVAKPQVIRILSDTLEEVVNNVEKRHLLVFINTGSNTTQIQNIYYFHDTNTGTATLQQSDLLEGYNNTQLDAAKMAAITSFLSSRYYAWFLETVDIANNFATVTVYVDGATLTEKRIVIKKVGAAIVEKDIAVV